MNISDIANGSFEFIGALMTLLNIRALTRDKTIQGVHWGPSMFFTSWGAFNLWFYPVNGLWWSFLGGVCIFLTNITWLSLVYYYMRKRNNG